MQPTREAECRYEQMRPHWRAADHYPALAEIDLQLPARRRLEAHRRPRLGQQPLPQRRAGSLHRAQAQRDAQLRRRFLAHHIGIAAVPDQPLLEPRLAPGQRRRPANPRVAAPAALAQIPPHRLGTGAELTGNPLGAPATTLELQHRRHLVRRPHHVPPRSLVPRGTLHHPCHAHAHHHLPNEKGGEFMSPGRVIPCRPTVREQRREKLDAWRRSPSVNPRQTAPQFHQK